MTKERLSHTKNERLWAIPSGHSSKMSNCEQITQVAHQKWANRLFLEQIAHSLIFFAKNEQLAMKTDEWIPNPVF